MSLSKSLIQRLRPLICPWQPLAGRVPEKASVLDIGCGTGSFLFHLAACGKLRKGRGIDISKSAIEAARYVYSKKAKDGGQLEFTVGGENIVPVEPVWDVVSMIDVLHHVPRDAQKQFVMDALAAVRPGGVFLYKDMCSTPFWRMLMNRLHDLVMARQWIHYVEIDELVAWVIERDFALEDSEDYARLWYGHEFRLFRRHGGQ